MPTNNEDASQEHPTQRLDNSVYEAPAGEDTRRLTGDNFPTNAAIAPQPVCGECGGEMVQVQLGGYVFRVESKSGAGFGAKRVSPVSGLVCSQCGFIKFFATDPGKVLE